MTIYARNHLRTNLRTILCVGVFVTSAQIAYNLVTK